MKTCCNPTRRSGEQAILFAGSVLFDDWPKDGLWGAPSKSWLAKLAPRALGKLLLGGVSPVRVGRGEAFAQDCLRLATYS